MDMAEDDRSSQNFEFMKILKERAGYVRVASSEMWPLHARFTYFSAEGELCTEIAKIGGSTKSADVR